MRGSSGSDDLEHGVVEGQLENLDKEVDGVALEVALGPLILIQFPIWLPGHPRG